MARRRIVSKKRYTQKTLHREREYGFFWYSWMWHLLRPLCVFLASALIVLGIASTGWNYFYRHFLMPFDPADPSTVTFKIPSGRTVTQISNDLVEQKLLRNSSTFKYLITFQGLTNKIQSGLYDLSPSMDPAQIVSVLTSGEVKSNERTIRIIPGWSIRDIAAYLVRVGALESSDEFLRLCQTVDLFMNDFYPLQQAVDGGTVPQRLYALEGYLAPDTYRIYNDASAESILRTLLKQNESVMDAAYDSSTLDADAVHFETTLTPDQTLILASVIEKEAGTKADYARVSAVFHNRLARQMRLESDPTVKYTQGLTKLVLTEGELLVDSPYNTYTRDGLPAGPICNPSADAIRAALYPDMSYINGEYLFFCSKDPASGELEFTKTKAEHEAAVALYRPLWIEYDRKQAEAAAAATPTPTPTAATTPAPMPPA